MNINKNEKELIKSIENDEWKSIKNLSSIKNQLKNAAKSTMIKE